jgi:putative nucleotidyltransferase with HDIG domain
MQPVHVLKPIAANGFYARLEAWFGDYVSGLDHADPRRRSKFELKRNHSLRVAGETASLAAAIGLGAGDAALAAVIGLLHDIGRFPQVERYTTFDDRVSVDHGELGADLIREHNLLAPLADEDRAVVDTAVRHHNKARLPEIPDGRRRLFARLVRDADKLDILRVIREKMDGPGRGLSGALPPGEDISSAVFADIAAAGSVHKDHIRSRIDWVFFRIGWLFDLNFAPTLARLEARGYHAMLRSLLPETPNIAAALERVDAHLALCRLPERAGLPQ